MSEARRSALTFSEAFDLPMAVDVRTAARALNICLDTAYRLIRQSSFPCSVVRVGKGYRIPTTSLMTLLGVEELPVYATDLEAGVNSTRYDE
ncbi:helix-turn-helix domain-containing protein [Streptomyces sp. NPDC050161]|uniref:helix-turn-helix domain-containing protein n=1 Tax=Streptomyces sp. NPDC050161 TaxID=3365604 RepID=UPI0037BDCBEB